MLRTPGNGGTLNLARSLSGLHNNPRPKCSFGDSCRKLTLLMESEELTNAEQ